jgi:tetratricopeptide (TPR) repeat protein
MAYKVNIKIISGLLFCLSVTFVHNAYTQSNIIDSLSKKLITLNNDTNKVNVLNNLSYFSYINGDFEAEMNYAVKALTLAKKLNWLKGIASSYRNKAGAHEDIGDYYGALTTYRALLLTYKKLKNKAKIAECHNSIGLAYFALGNYAKALEHYFIYLKYVERVNELDGLAHAYGNIGTIYGVKAESDNAIKYFTLSLEIMKKLRNEKGMANCYMNLGNTFADANDETALDNYFLAIELFKKLDNKKGLANGYNNVSILYKNKNNFVDALKYQQEALKLKQAINDIIGIAASYTNLGVIYTLMNNPIKGREMQQLALAISISTHDKETLASCYNGLSAADSALGNYKSAFENYKQFILYRDSLINEESNQKILRAQMQYEFGKKAAADSVVNVKQQEIKNAEIARQKTEIKAKRNQQYFLFGGLVLVLFFALVMYNRFKITSKQKQEIERQKNLVEVKQSEIIDSIKYASRIQKALLPSENYIKNKLKKNNA